MACPLAGLALLGLGGLCPVSQEALDAKWRLEERFGFEIVSVDDQATSWRSLEGAGVWSEPLEAFLPLLEEELERYPDGFLGAVGIDRVVLGHHLHRGDSWLGGMASTGDKAIFLSVPLTTFGCRYAAKTIHHEVFHMVDLNNPHAFPRDEWESLNPTGFVYRWSKWGEEPQPLGFVSRYATRNATEDRAETFETMVVDGLGWRGNQGTTGVLGAKVAFLARGLLEVEPRLLDGFRDGAWSRSGGTLPAGCKAYQEGGAATRGPACRCARAPSLCVVGIFLALGLGFAGWRVISR